MTPEEIDALRKAHVRGYDEGLEDAFTAVLEFMEAAAKTAEMWEGPSYMPMRHAIAGLREIRKRLPKR